MPRTPMHYLALGALLSGSMWAASPALAAASLSEELRALAERHGFHVQGIGRIGAEDAELVDGDLTTKLRALLADYNHVIEGVPPAVERVIILGAKQATPGAQAIRTTRRRGHHVVSARLQGAPGRRASAELIVDTGASTIVLPDSMMAPLGFRGADLGERQSQTVNGMITGRAATLASVSIGGAIARDVAVLFVPDDRLGGVSLLGMSFLKNFSITIDDADSRLLLAPR